MPFSLHSLSPELRRCHISRCSIPPTQPQCSWVRAVTLTVRIPIVFFTAPIVPSLLSYVFGLILYASHSLFSSKGREMLLLMKNATVVEDSVGRLDVPIALTTPQLWTTIPVGNRHSLRVMSFLLEHSGRRPLCVRFEPDFDDISKKVIIVLRPHADRIHGLYFRNSSTFF